MDTTAPARPVFFRRISIGETAILLASACLVPFLVHLIPFSGARPLGAYVLPMFWATFVAAYFYGARIAVVTALAAPAVNLLFTGRPALAFVGISSLELVLFALLAAWATRRFPRLWLSAPLGYLAARIVTTTLVAATGILSNNSASGLSFGIAFAHLPASIARAISGLLILGLINLVLIRNYPKAR
jgi:hypothetical protein